ncbi:S8 family peptidase [Streptomyces sp. NBC_00829]|uniref:S8 family peptidase n=1 Tax=Streptomyces sp. NBC_00829 TaxID=2903679 RepID=UPI00386EE0FD|nr:S8 family serine peptidase [Streptomyces sp. NBC_00829]
MSGLTALILTAAVAAAGAHPAVDPAPTNASPGQWSAGLRAVLVIAKDGASPADLARIRAAVVEHHGTVYTAYDEIGVLVAHSTDSGFAAAMRQVPGVVKAGATRTSDIPKDAYGPALPATPAEKTDTSPEQPVRWDMTQIHADKAWDTNAGSSSVTVGVLDTGVDDQHPDLKANFAPDKSASCAYGKPDQRPGAWRPGNDHGTHVAGTIAAAKNGHGVVGVAPGVKVAAVRVSEPARPDYFFPEATICSFLWSAQQGFPVVNMSAYVDPWRFACGDDLDQAAIIEGVSRAVAYAQRKNVLVVAAAGNDSQDLAHKSTDGKSPNDSKTINRNVNDACLKLPTELPGVVTVSASGKDGKLADFSNYGSGKITVTAPGVEINSTLPGGGYGNKQGTSMATPHVAGVAALLASAHPGATAATLRTLLTSQATRKPCPADDSRCTGAPENNSFFGAGEVNALAAVSVAPGTGAPGGVRVGASVTAGELTMTVPDGAKVELPPVKFGQAASTGAPLPATTVHDYRGGKAGWSLTGKLDSDLTSPDKHTIPATNLHWTPACTTTTAGSPSTCTPGTPGALGTTAATLAGAPTATTGTGGDFTAQADLNLNIPAFTPTGTYTTTLTLTLA